MKRILLLVLIMSFLTGYAQVMEIANPGDTNPFVSQAFVQFKGSAFFDNLEFFNNIEKGYTLAGFNLEPRLGLIFSPRASATGGFHLLYYAGENGLSTLAPVLTISTLLCKNLKLNIGSIDASNGHNLPQPLFMREREYVKQPETGVQLLAGGKFMESDAWINWEKFIFPGDTIQEEFTVGFSGKIKLINRNLRLEVPLYGIAAHKGGQINNSGGPVSTLANFGGGISVAGIIGADSKFGADGLFFLGRDLSPNPTSPFKRDSPCTPKFLFIMRYSGSRLDTGGPPI